MKKIEMALDSKKAACFVKNSVSVFSVLSYRFVRKYPFFSSSVLSFGVLYIFYPRLFFFLVSSSPVLISTALLLGTLLSLGQPHIPQIDDLEEEEVSLEATSKGREKEEEEDEKKRSNDFIKERSGDEPHLRSIDIDGGGDDDDDGADSIVTKVSRRSFEEGIDDFSTRGYLYAEPLLGKRTEIVETIEEEEQFYVDNLDDNEDQTRDYARVENVDSIPTHKREEVATVENNEAKTIIHESGNDVETGLEKEPKNIDHGEGISDEKTGEKETLDGAEGHDFVSDDKKKEVEMENHAQLVNYSDTDSVTERTFDKPMKEAEEGMPLLGNLSSSSQEVQEEGFHSRNVDTDLWEGTSKLVGSNDNAEAEFEGEPKVEGADDVEENGQKASLENLFPFSLQSSWKRFVPHHSPPDSGSDAAESISSDASLGQLDPMFDEHHPLLEYEGSKACSISDSSVEERFHVEEFSPRERVSEDLIAFPDEPHASYDLHEEEEEEDEVQNDFGFTWTEEDEKNLRDLGLSVRERQEQEERMIAHLHVQHPQRAQEDNLIDFISEERASFIEEENLVEIGVAGDTTTNKDVENRSESLDHQHEGRIDSEGKEIPVEVCFDSTDRGIAVSFKPDSEYKEEGTEIQFDQVGRRIPNDSLDHQHEERIDSEVKETPLQVHFNSTNRGIPVSFRPDSEHKEEGTEIQFDQVRRGSPNELPEGGESTDHLNRSMQNDLALPEDQIQSLRDACRDETHQEEADIDAISAEKIECSARSVFPEDIANEHDQFHIHPPIDSLPSFETGVFAKLESSPEFQMHVESLNADASSVEEEQLEFEKKTVLDDDLSSLSSSVDDTGMTTMEATATESHIVHEEIPVSYQKDFDHHSEEVEADKACSVSVMEIQKENEATVVEVFATEESESGVDEGKERTDGLSCSALDQIKSMPRELMEDKSTTIEENIQDVSPKASQECVEAIGTISRDAPSVMEIQRGNLITIEEVDFSDNQHEKFEKTYAQSSCSTEDEVDPKETKSGQVEPTMVGELPTEITGTVEKDPGLELEVQRDMSSTEQMERQSDMALTEEQETKEDIEKHFDDSSSSASGETESSSSEVIQEELPTRHDEVQDIPLKTFDASTEIVENTELDLLPAGNMHGDSFPTGEDEKGSEAEESESEETKEPSDDLGFTESNIGTSESQEGLIVLEIKSKEELESVFGNVVSSELENKYEEKSESQEGLTVLEIKSKEELESVFGDVVSSELENKYEENQSGAPETNEESAAKFESAEQDSTPEMVIPRDSGEEDASPEEQHLMLDEAQKTSDDSSSSASDIGSDERLEELTFLEVNSKEQIEAILKEAIAEESGNKHKEFQVSSSQDSDEPTETVEPTKLDSPHVVHMEREISSMAAVCGSPTEGHQPKLDKTEELCDDLSSAAVEVRKSPPSDGEEVQ